jgi:iron complex outermembrane recepter protein
MLRRTKLARGLALAFGGSMTIAAVAQTTSTTLDRVEITGSNIKRIDAESASPIQIISREEIRRTGASSVRELINALPASTPTALSDISGSNSFASGASSASLRNLGKQSTLILLNFRRVSPYALADYNEVFTNLDALPLEAIERVEILRSGASAIYGSDAVAGVINIITRKDYRGLQIGGSHEQSLTSPGKFKQSTASITGGFGDLSADRFNVLANVEFFKRDNVMWRDVLDKMNPTTKAKIPQTLVAQYSTFSYPGNLVGVGPIAGCPPELLIGGLCRYDRYSRFEAMPAAERVTALVSGRFAVNATTEAFAEALWSNTKTTYLSPFQPYGPAVGPTTWGDPATGSARTFTPFGLPAGHPLNPTGAYVNDFRYRFVDGPAEASADSDNYRLLFGVRGVMMGKWDWETAVAFLGAKTVDRQRGNFSDSGFKEVIGDYSQPTLPADFFNKPGGYRIGEQNSAEVINKLFPSFGTDAKTSQTAIDGKISGEIAQWAAGPVTMATGFDLRREKFTITPTSHLLTGDIVGFGNAQTNAARTFGAVFAEVNLPITKTLEAQVAARLDKFPGFDAQLSPKVALRYQPVPALLFRGGIESGFRAPNLTESAQSTKFAFSNGVVDPKRCSQAQAYAGDLLTQANALPANDPNRTILEAHADIVEQNECSAGVANIAANNPNLKPEVSRSLSLGMVFEPVKGFNFSIDYWNIKRKDEIGIKTTQELLAAEDALPPGSRIERDTSFVNDSTFTDPFGVISPAALRSQYGVTVGPLQSITNVFENVSKTKTSGFDLALNTVTDVPVGKLDLSAQATYVSTYYQYSTVINGFGDNLAGNYEYPRWQASLSAALITHQGRLTNGFKIRHTSSYSYEGDYYDTGWCDFLGTTNCRVGAETMLDYFFSFKPVKNLTLNAYVRNLLGKQPAANLRKLFEDGSNTIPQSYEDARRRTLKVSLEYKFF